MTSPLNPSWLLVPEPYAPVTDVTNSPALAEAYERGLVRQRRKRGWSKAQRDAYTLGRTRPSAPAPWWVELAVTGVEAVLAALPESTFAPKASSVADDEGKTSVTRSQVTMLLPLGVPLVARFVRRRAQGRRARKLGLTSAAAPRRDRELVRSLANGAFQSALNRSGDALGPPWARKLALSLASDFLLRRSWRRAMRVTTASGSIIATDVNDEQHQDNNGATAARVRRG